MKKQLLIVALLIGLPTAVLFLLSWFVQPLLPAPWNNALILLGVVITAALALMSGLADTLQVARWLSGEDDPPATQQERGDVGGSDISGKVEAGGDVVGRDKKIGGSVVGRDQYNFEGQQIFIVSERVAADYLRAHRPPSATATDLQHATARYLTYLINRYQFLDFKGMGVSDRVALRLPLLEMYVPLKARIEMPEGETWAREMRLAGRPITEEEAASMGERLSAPQPVLDLLAKQDGLIILGDPGAGKSTFLKYLALLLATGQHEALGLGQRLPVLLPLSAYANALAEQDVPLDRFIADYYRDLGVDVPLHDLLRHALASGGALLLLDGLDEVRQLEQRHTVINRVRDFFALHQQNQYLRHTFELKKGKRVETQVKFFDQKQPTGGSTHARNRSTFTWNQPICP